MASNVIGFPDADVEAFLRFWWEVHDSGYNDDITLDEYVHRCFRDEMHSITLQDGKVYLVLFGLDGNVYGKLAAYLLAHDLTMGVHSIHSYYEIGVAIFPKGGNVPAAG